MTVKRRLLVLAGVALCACPTNEPGWSVPIERQDGGALLSAWTRGEELVAVGGDLDGSRGLVVRAGADGWCAEPDATDRPLWWAAGSGERWFAVGEDGQIIRDEGGARVDESVTTEATLFGVWDTGTVVWAVGGTPRAETPGGEVWRRDEAGAWALVADQFPGPLFKVHEDWIVGVGSAWRIEGDALVDMSPAGEPRLLTVRKRADDDVWAVGGSAEAEVWHWTGSWARVDMDPYCTNQALNGVWTAPGEDVWVAGQFGAMARWTGTEWDCPETPLSDDHFHAAWPWDGATWFFGGDLFRMGSNHFTVGRWGQGPETIEVGDCG